MPRTYECLSISLCVRNWSPSRMESLEPHYRQHKRMLLLHHCEALCDFRVLPAWFDFSVISSWCRGADVDL